MVNSTVVSNQNILIVGDDIEEITNHCLTRIRPQSQEYYRKEILKDLLDNGFSWVDYHGGMKISYDIVFINSDAIKEKYSRMLKLHYGKKSSLIDSLKNWILKYQTSKGHKRASVIYRIETYKAILHTANAN